MGRCAENLINKRYNLLTVKCQNGRKNNRILWDCLCDCGNQCVVSGHDLKSNNTKSCGCLRYVDYKSIDLKGIVFGKLKVLGWSGKNKHGQYLWLCVCDCGKEKIIQSNSLRNGDTKSCGCLQKEINIKRCTIHGRALRNKISSIYNIYQSMKQRCYDTNSLDYKNYGERGITICNRWLEPKGIGFKNFLKDVGERPVGKSIDRVNNNGNYCPENHKWSTPKEQSRNQRSNTNIIYKKKIQCLSAWAEEYNIPYTTLWKRIFKYKWSIEKALITTVRKQKKYLNECVVKSTDNGCVSGKCDI